MENIKVLDDPKFRLAIGELLGISQQAITNWKKRGIPAEHCPDIEALTGIKCEVLRPGVNWAVLRKQPRKAHATAQGMGNV